MAVVNISSKQMCGLNKRYHKQYNLQVLINQFCTFVVFCIIFMWQVKPIESTTSCNEVRMGFQMRGVNITDLLVKPTNGQHLRVCPILGQTCCTEGTENRLQQHSKQQFEKTVKDSMVKLSSILNTRAQRFDEYFQNMLINSKKEFHEMFKKTYGVIYVQNSYVFTDLFSELENYYNKGRVDLAEAMDSFFSVLYQRMFTVINSQYHFDEKYLSCVADHMKDLKPFGDVPQKLSIQIKRSFVAARTFAKAIAVGAEVSKNMLNIKTSQECSKSLLRMHHCSGCAGKPEARACSNYCINVMKGCLAYHSSLESEWNNYVDAMDKISDRLLGSFNIEMVVEPIDIKISEAIMNFQENGPDVSQRVFTGCGKPILGRRRRSINTLRNEYHNNLLRIKYYQPDDLDIQFEGSEVLERNLIVRKPRATNREVTFEPLKFKNNADDSESATTSGKRGGKVAHAKQESPTLEKLIRDIRHNVRESKRFWSNLPYQICNNEDIAVGPSKNEICWNGTAISEYLPPVVADGIMNQKHNPDVFVDINRQNSMLNEQIYALKAITNKIMNAFQGMDVEWIDDDESFATYASGSGSGDSNNEDDTEPDSTDDNDMDEGSGYHTDPPVYIPIDPKISIIPPPEIFPKIPTNKTESDNEIPDSSGGTSKSQQQMTLTRALISYLAPIVVIWFGGMFTDLL